MGVMDIITVFVISVAVFIGIFVFMWWIIPKNCNHINSNSTNMDTKYSKTKCSHCGHKFEVTKSSASGVEWDFDGPDYYKFVCPKCGRTHFVSQFNL